MSRGRENVVYRCMPLFLPYYFFSSFLLLSLFIFSFSLSVFSPPYSFLPLASCLSLLLFMATPFYIVCYYRIYPFFPLTVFGFLQASLQDHPLTYWLSSHYLCLECVGCSTLHFEKKLLVLFLTALCFCFTSMDKD